MRGRTLMLSLLLVALGGVGGYALAFWTGAPVPDFIQRIRYRSFAAVDEAQLRAALNAGNRLMSHTASTIGRGGTVAASTALAQTIRFSRGQSVRGRTYPLSDEMKALYAPYFPKATLDRVRWTLADRRLSLGSLLAGWYYREGAVTLDDVIVFSNMAAATHRGLVAHELTHVVQYEQLGLDDFARLYTINWQLIEEQARRNAGRITADIERRQDDPPPAVP